MNRQRQRQVARGLLVLSCVLLVAVPVSMFIMCFFVSPLGMFGMGVGAYGYYEQRDPDFGWHFEYQTAFKTPAYLFLPTAGSRPVQFTIPTWMVFAASAALTFFAFRRSRIQPGQCARCGYDLTGNVSGVCPECGSAVASKPDEAT